MKFFTYSPNSRYAFSLFVLFFHTDETRKRLENSKLTADKALNISAMVTEMTDPMSKNANMWKEDLSNSDFDASAYNSVVNAAGETSKQLPSCTCC